MKVRLRVGGYGGLNPIALREDGWDSDMWLEAEQTNNPIYPYRVTLPNGCHRFIKDSDIKEHVES